MGTSRELFPHGKILFSSPGSAYDLIYSINPWMKPEKNHIDKRLAVKQWTQLINTVIRLGAYAEVVSVPQPDGVFSANAGFVHRDIFIPSSFRHEERQTEEQYWLQWAKKATDYEGRKIFKKIFIINEPFEGAGDALPTDDYLCIGHGFRTTYEGAKQVTQLLSAQSLLLELADPYWYHLDTCFCPLSSYNEVLYYPKAFKNPETISDIFDKAIPVVEEDAKKFACNAVVLGKDIVLPLGCDDTMSKLCERGYRCHPIDMSEFIKTGGACKCLTLKF